MSEKPLSSNNGDVAQDEKHSAGVPQTELADASGGRRKSVALNIVHNPLKVSFPNFQHVALLLRHLP